MRRVALKGLAFRKVRALLTALAVVLGVAMVSGTYVLTDSIQRAFDGIFTGSYDDTSAVISDSRRVRPEVGPGRGGPSGRSSSPTASASATVIRRPSSMSLGAALPTAARAGANQPSR